MEKTFLWNIIILYAFYRNFVNFTGFEKKSSAFQNKSSIVLKTLLYVFEKAYCFSFLLYFADEKLSNWKSGHFARIIGKKNVKKTHRVERIIFLSYYKSG